MSEDPMNLLIELEELHEKLGEELRKIQEKYGNRGISVAERLLDIIIEKYGNVIRDSAKQVGFNVKALWGLVDVDEYGLPYITITIYDPTIKSPEDEEVVEKYGNLMTKLSESGEKLLEEIVDNPYVTLIINNVPPPKIKFFEQ